MTMLLHFAHTLFGKTKSQWKTIYCILSLTLTVLNYLSLTYQNYYEQQMELLSVKGVIWMNK